MHTSQFLLIVVGVALKDEWEISREIEEEGYDGRLLEMGERSEGSKKEWEGDT